MQNKISEALIACAFEVHRALGPGFLEKVYANALLIELQERGLHAATEQRVNVYYKGQVVGDYIADLVVEDCLILEIKAVHNLVPEHEVQLVNYLTATGIEDGLLINFGAPSVQVKHKYRTFRAKRTPASS